MSPQILEDSIFIRHEPREDIMTPSLYIYMHVRKVMKPFVSDTNRVWCSQPMLKQVCLAFLVYFEWKQHGGVTVVPSELYS